MAQLTCSNQTCRLPLMYPRGARQVQCSICGTLNDSMAANSIGHIICGMCHITLMVSHTFSTALLLCSRPDFLVNMCAGGQNTCNAPSASNISLCSTPMAPSQSNAQSAIM